MRNLFAAWHTVDPRKNGPHGPLPFLLVLLTLVTGLVDAFSFLRLGRVFVANMTGNVVLLGFALAQVQGFLWYASGTAILAFGAGAFLGGRIAHRHGRHRGRHILAASIVQTLFVAVSAMVAIVAAKPFPAAITVLLIALLAIGMGVQNATARALAVPDLTTTVLTQTLTGLSADTDTDGKAGRRIVSVLSMFAGALCGALLIESGNTDWVLVIVLLLLIAVTVLSARASLSTSSWTAKR
jgi:uncharacterized membrane protein YoaK (UPF0700 family)